jgi:hypothetical protein
MNLTRSLRATTPLVGLLLATLLAGCTEETAEALADDGFEVQPDPDMPLRGIARWDETRWPEAWVSYDGDRRGVARVDGGATLLGLPEAIDVEARLVTREGVVATTTFRTGSLPGALDLPEVSGSPLEEGYLLTTRFGLDGTEPVLWAFDAEGRVVWYHQLPEIEGVGGSPALYALRQEPGAVWVAVQGREARGVLRVPFDGSPTRWVDLPGAHHDFTLLEAGSIAYTRAAARTLDGETVTGDLLVVRAPDGTERIAWDSFATLDIRRHNGWDVMQDVQGDWTHANGIFWDPANRLWTVSLYWLRELVLIDDTTGNVVRRVEGMNTPKPFGPQHSPVRVSDGWWMLDNGNGSAHATRALHINDEGQHVESWAPPGDPYSPAMGSVRVRRTGIVMSMGMLNDVWVLPKSGNAPMLLRWESPGHGVGEADWVETLDVE